MASTSSSKSDCLICLSKTSFQIECGCHFHLKCLRTYIIDYRQNEMIPWTCPGCNVPYKPHGIIEDKEIKEIVKRNRSKAYEFLGSSREYRKILGEGTGLLFPCSQDGCKGFYLRKKEGCFCSSCQHAVCEDCFEEHSGRCDPDIVATVKKTMESCKNCPKCGTQIGKDGGCDHMTCKNCRYEFWWTSLEPYTLVNHNNNANDGVLETVAGDVVKVRVESGRSEGSAPEIKKCKECNKRCYGMVGGCCCNCVDRRTGCKPIRVYKNGKFKEVPSWSKYCERCKNRFSD